MERTHRRWGETSPADWTLSSQRTDGFCCMIIHEGDECVQGQYCLACTLLPLWPLEEEWRKVPPPSHAHICLHVEKAHPILSYFSFLLLLTPSAFDLVTAWKPRVDRPALFSARCIVEIENPPCTPNLFSCLCILFDQTAGFLVDHDTRSKDSYKMFCTWTDTTLCQLRIRSSGVKPCSDKKCWVAHKVWDFKSKQNFMTWSWRGPRNAS